MVEHNLASLLDSGLMATINSDDPAYFGGYLNKNLTDTFAALPGLGAREAYTLARNSFEASFVDPVVRDGWIEKLDLFFEEACRYN